MSEERDPELQSLFARAHAELPAAAFTAALMEKISAKRRTRGLLAAALTLFAGFCAWWLALPLQQAINSLTLGLMASLFEVENAWLAVFLAPVNNVGALVAVGLLLMWVGYRRIFDRT